MVAEVYNAVAEGEITTTDAYIYACIARHACPRTKYAFPHQSTLLNYTPFGNIKTIKRAINKLKKVGLIEVERKWSNRYYLPFHKLNRGDDDE